MKKWLLTFFVLIFSIITVQAKNIKSDFTSVIRDSGVDSATVAISIKDANTGKIVYSLNDKMLTNPASIQKVLTAPVSVQTLGEDYKFRTELYKRGEDSYIIKLGADPYFTSSDLKNLLSNIEKTTKRIYIDNSILDSKQWGEGWQWDDDLNVLMPRFGSYNLDGNLLKLTIMPAEDGGFATVINPSKYPLVFVNNVRTGAKTQIDIKRDNSISANTIMLTGTVAGPCTVFIPNSNLKNYFDVRLQKTLENKKVYMKEPITVDRVKSTDKLVGFIEHSLNSAVQEELKTSNNMIAEVVFKLAGKKYCNLETGTDVSGIKMFNDYCKNNNLDNSKIRITDASGVSKNNLVTADFITEFLYKNKDNKVLRNNLPIPGEGTLRNRMLPLKQNVQAKTGTLSNISSLAGYLTTKSNKDYVFCIMINDTELSPSNKKLLEEFIIKEAYIRL